MKNWILAFISGWNRFKEVRHQQRMGRDGALSVYAALWAETQDWRNALGKSDLPLPSQAVVDFVPVQYIPGVD